MLDRAFAMIMAGGKGERFWPLSTTERPKQTLALVDERPMLALAISYLEGLVPPDRILVITNERLVDQIAVAAPSLPRKNIIGEPVGRDTAAACALGASIVKAREPNGALCVLTADHVIGDIAIFQRVLREGFALARSREALITIGIRPTFPSTGFGYIESGEAITHDGEVEFHAVVRFVEKPAENVARQYIEAGRFFWNSGMFIWTAATFLSALSEHCPQLREMSDNVLPAVDTPRFLCTLAREYDRLEKISVDYAVMEKADNIIMARGTFRWDDVGSWPALENHFDAGADGNVFIGDCEAIGATGNIVVSPGRLTALIGVEDLVVVQAEGATLVCTKDRAQEVKQMVQRLAQRGDCDQLL